MAAKIQNEGSRRPNAWASRRLGIRTSERPDVRASGRPSVRESGRPSVWISENVQKLRKVHKIFAKISRTEANYSERPLRRTICSIRRLREFNSIIKSNGKTATYIGGQRLVRRSSGSSFVWFVTRYVENFFGRYRAQKNFNPFFLARPKPGRKRPKSVKKASEKRPKASE